MKKKKYWNIIKHYESCLEKFGDSNFGVDWPKLDDVNKRYKVMLDIIDSKFKTKKISLLDFGCGASHLYNYIIENNLGNIEYSGLDISEKFITLSKKKFPFLKFYCNDILEDKSNLPNFDYIVMHGVFTESCDLLFDEMFDYFKKMIIILFGKVNIGITFNVMSKHVDWERDDLFHLPFDSLAKFLKKEISRHFIIRNDYGLYEYTVYVYKESQL